MNQFYLFIVLLTITFVILVYQSYTFEGFVNKEQIDGILSLDSNNIFIDVGKKTADDSILKSNNTLYVKDKINFNFWWFPWRISLDEELFKKIKSFSEIYYFDFKKGQKLCLKDNKNTEVCCDKVDLGVLTGQTPLQFKLVKPKQIYENQVVDKDKIYDTLKVSNDGKKTSFYDKNFFILPKTMINMKTETNQYKDIINPLLKPISAKFTPDSRFESSNIYMTGFPDKNYYCYLLNQSGDITTVA